MRLLVARDVVAGAADRAVSGQRGVASLAWQRSLKAKCRTCRREMRWNTTSNWSVSDVCQVGPVLVGH